MNLAMEGTTITTELINTSVIANNSRINELTTINSRLLNYQYPLFMVNVVICCFNLTGNVTVLVLICQRRLLGRTTNVFVFSLAMADALCCIGAIPYNIFAALELTMSVYMCKGYFYVLCISRTAVSYTVVLLTTEKILNILHPSRFITAGRCMFFICLVWFFATAYNIWTVVFYTVYDTDLISDKEILDDPTKGLFGNVCFFSHKFNFLQGIFLALDVAVLFVIPCFILTLQFCVIVRKQHGSIKQRFETYCYIMRFLIFIFFIFITCHTPFEISTMIKPRRQVIPHTYTHTELFYDISLTVYYCRGIFNLIIYIYFKHYVCRRRRHLSNAANAGNKTQLELPERRPYRGLSINETRPLQRLN